MKAYSFADLVTHSLADGSAAKHWVQTNTIRPDIEGTTGTGKHRTFGFLDVFEACVAHQLNRLPGGMPVRVLSSAFDRLRFEAALVERPWREFLLHESRRDSARFWLCRTHTGLWNIATDDTRDAILDVPDEAVIVLPLHRLLLDLEHRTEDHAVVAECDAAWMKEKPRSRERRHAVESVTHALKARL